MIFIDKYVNGTKSGNQNHHIILNCLQWNDSTSQLLMYKSFVQTWQENTAM